MNQVQCLEFYQHIASLQGKRLYPSRGKGEGKSDGTCCDECGLGARESQRRSNTTDTQSPSSARSTEGRRLRVFFYPDLHHKREGNSCGKGIDIDSLHEAFDISLKTASPYAGLQLNWEYRGPHCTKNTRNLVYADSYGFSDRCSLRLSLYPHKSTISCSFQISTIPVEIGSLPYAGSRISRRHTMRILQY